jgi:hypothetical protein
MKQKFKLSTALVSLTFIFGCNFNIVQNYKLTDSERKICDSLQIDSTIVQDIRKFNTKKIEPFHYSLSKMIKDGQETELNPIHLNGLVISEQNSKSYNLVFNLKDDFKKKGYTIFLLENNFDINKKLDYIGVLKTVDKYTVLKQIATDGINYNITNDSLIKIIKQFDRKYSLELVGASGDWCEFVIHTVPTDWDVFAKEVYKICPDVVDQGTGKVEALADEMKKTMRLYFWWD